MISPGHRSEPRASGLSLVVVVLASAATLALAALLGSRPSSLLLSGLVAVCGLIGLLMVPDLSLSSLVFVAFFVPIEISVSASVKVNAALGMVPVLAVVWLLRSLRQHRLHIAGSRAMLALFVLVVAATVSWLYGNAVWDPLVPRPSNLLFIQLGQWAIYALSAAIFMVAAQQPLRALRWATWVFLALGALAVAVAYFAPGWVPTSVRFVGIAKGNGGFIALFTAIAGGQALFNRQMPMAWRRVLLALALAVPLLGFWKSRSMILQWAPALVVLGVLLWLRSRRVFLLVLLSSAVFFLATLSFWIGSYDWAAEWQNSGEGRLILWRTVFDVAKREPVLGLGLTSYRHYNHWIPILIQGGAQWWRPNVNSHNVYIDIFAQMGAVGLVIFFWAIAEIGRLGLRLKDRFVGGFEAAYVRGSLAALVGLLAASMLADLLIPFVYNVGFTGFRYSAMAWMFLGGLVALDAVPRAVDRPITDDAI